LIDFEEGIDDGLFFTEKYIDKKVLFYNKLRGILGLSTMKSKIYKSYSEHPYFTTENWE